MPHEEFERKAFDGISLYFQVWQTEQVQKGVICLEHGLGEHSGRYAAWAEMLNGAGYSVLAYDLRGHGKSGGMRGHVESYDEYLRDADLSLEETKSRFPGMPVFLYGHSLGAIIICDYVLHRKPAVNGVVLSALSVNTALQQQKLKIFIAKILGSIVPKFTMSSGLVPATISRDPQVVERYVKDPMVHDRVTAAWGKSSLETIDWIDQHVGEWMQPVLIMHGELDQLGYAAGSREFASRVKGDCTLKIWPGLTHEIHNEPEKAEVFDFLRQWLDKHANHGRLDNG